MRLFGSGSPRPCGPGAVGVDQSTSVTRRNTRPNNLNAPSHTSFNTIQSSSSHHGTFEASNTTSDSRSFHITTPPPCRAERYSKRTRTSPRRPMSLFQRLRSWAQYVLCHVKVNEAKIASTEQPTSWYRPAAYPREEDPPGTEDPNVVEYNRVLTSSRPQI
jgi:hypothetical protein